MLPCRSGFRLFRGARLSFVLLLAGSSLAVAGERKHRKASPTPTPGEAFGLKNIPLTVGHEAKGLILPNYDIKGRLIGRFEAATAARVDENHVRFTDLKMTTYDEREQADFKVDMSDAVLDLETRVIDSKAQDKGEAGRFRDRRRRHDLQHHDQIGIAQGQRPHDPFQPEGNRRRRRQAMKKIAAFLFALALLARAEAQDSITAKAADKPPASPAVATTDANGQPIATQIYADEASFDTEKRIGIFSGHVRVFDPRFNIQSDKLTVYIHKEEGEGLEKAIAEGHVGVVRDKPDPKGGKSSKAVGLAEKAVYTSADGNVVLTGSPRVQQGLDTHVATSPDTVMVLNQDGHLTTRGPSRTEIRQDSKKDKGGKPSPDVETRNP